MSKKQNLYTGRSAQLAVMAEFLRRGYNAAIPEIDVGDDIFVVRDADGDLSRIQVKGAIGKGVATISGRFSVPLAQLRRPHEPELYYIFAVHFEGVWREFVILRRDALENLRDVEGIGAESVGRLGLHFSYRDDDVVCNAVSLGNYRNNWEPWPLIHH
jgi:hypothetical protein